MKKILTLIILILVFSFSCCYASSFDITSHNAILYNLNEDSILFEKNSDERVSIASLTKIMTALVAIENIDDLNKEVVITARDFEGTSGYSKAGFKVGDEVTVLDLLYGVLLPSGAEAVNKIVNITTGDELSFVKLMNDKASELDLNNTMFANPIGKDNVNNYSTAKDIAKLLKYALENEIFKNIFTTKNYIVPSTGLELKHTIMAYSDLLDVSIIDGAKSGFTKDAGRCLASTSSDKDVNFLFITIKSDLSEPFNAVKDTLTIYNYYYDNYSYQDILNKEQIIDVIPIKNSKVKEYEIKSSDDIFLYLENEVSDNLTYKYEGVEILDKNIKVGDKLGVINVYNNESLLYTMDVYLNESISYYNPFLLLSIILIVVVFLIILTKKKKRRRRKR